MVRRTGGQVVRRSGGQVVQVVRAIHDGQGGPSGPDDSCGPYGPGDQASQGGPGGQVVRVVRLATLDDMISENIWFHALNH